MTSHFSLEEALALTWHRDVAEQSLSRWRELSAQEGWDLSNETMVKLVMLFGASWHFTRFCFFRGRCILPLLGSDYQSVASIEQAIDTIDEMTAADSLDNAIDNLRIKKNEMMLLILMQQLAGLIDQEQAEALLTRLAHRVLRVMYHLFALDQFDDIQCVVLAMGRFAGFEMSYGSDLDLVFLKKGTSVHEDAAMGNKIRKMLRYISTVNPSGVLYEIDMRLRPHGNSGVLVTPLTSFMQFHQQERAIWERQMMTRCRVIIGDHLLSKNTQYQMTHHVYIKYDIPYLAKEIMKVRLLVQQEQTAGHHQIELKRGEGGIMDIDFLTHFFQLAYGHEQPQLQTASTRKIIKELAALSIINKETASLLRDAYDFYKKSEAALRIFDMKSISKVDKSVQSLLPLARATGCFGKDSDDRAVMNYQETLMAYRRDVRTLFNKVLSEAA